MMKVDTLVISRRRAMTLVAILGASVISGCQEAEVGSNPPIGKSRKEVIGDEPPSAKGGKKAKAK